MGCGTIVRALTELEKADISALQKFLLDDEQRPGEPADVETRLKERLLQAREMPEHAAALRLIGDR
jgi:hypothetical protein